MVIDMAKLGLEVRNRLFQKGLGLIAAKDELSWSVMGK